MFLFLGVEWVLHLLVILSIISLAITLERLFYLSLHKENLEELQKSLRKHLENGDITGAQSSLEDRTSHVAAILKSGLEVFDRGPGAVEEAMRGTSKLAKMKLERGLVFLGTLGNNAPFIGLFGTVLGIIRAFRDLATNTTEGSTAVMAGIAEALVATAVGLLVALPAVAIFNAFQRAIKRKLSGTEALGHLLLTYSKSSSK